MIPKKRNIKISYICSFILILSCISILQCEAKRNHSSSNRILLLLGHQMNDKLVNILLVLIMLYCSTIIVLFEHMSRSKIFHFFGSLVSECIINAKSFISQGLAPKGKWIVTLVKKSQMIQFLWLLEIVSNIGELMSWQVHLVQGSDKASVKHRIASPTFLDVRQLFFSITHPGKLLSHSKRDQSGH